MRLSVDENDPGFRPHLYAIKVYFMGTERSHVITADEERRLIVAHQLDSKGHPRLNTDGTQVLRETLYGDVRIEIPAGHYLLAAGATEREGQAA